MSKKVDDTLARVEEMQAALRKSIDDSTHFAAASDRLIQIHKKQLQDAKPMIDRKAP